MFPVGKSLRILANKSPLVAQTTDERGKNNNKTDCMLIRHIIYVQRGRCIQKETPHMQNRHSAASNKMKQQRQPELRCRTHKRRQKRRYLLLSVHLICHLFVYVYTFFYQIIYVVRTAHTDRNRHTRWLCIARLLSLSLSSPILHSISFVRPLPAPVL